MKVRVASTKERLALFPGAKDSVLLIADDGTRVLWTIMNGKFFVHDAVGAGGMGFAAIVQRVREDARRMGFEEIIFHVDLPGDMEKFIEMLERTGRGRKIQIWAAMKV